MYLNVNIFDSEAVVVGMTGEKGSDPLREPEFLDQLDNLSVERVKLRAMTMTIGKSERGGKGCREWRDIDGFD